MRYVEEHYWDWAIFQIETALLLMEQGLDKEELRSALYGKFVGDGCPKIDGYDERRKVMVKIVKAIIKKVKRRCQRRK